jgi:hypothetical protein
MRISEFIINFVLNSAWQIVAIFAVASLVSWLLRNGPARYRHTLWVVAMLASLVVPLLTATRFVPAFVADFQAPIQTNISQNPSLSDIEDLSFDHITPEHPQPLVARHPAAHFCLLAFCVRQRHQTRPILAAPKEVATISDSYHRGD